MFFAGFVVGWIAGVAFVVAWAVMTHSHECCGEDE